MLEVKILKLRHVGREAAVQLRPYIKECDIFSPEAAGLSLQEADNYENVWSELLLKSRIQFKKSFRNPTNKYEEYSQELQESIFRSGKPLYILERFGVEESARIKDMGRKFQGPYSADMLKRAISGEREPLDMLRFNLTNYIQSLLLRDQEIGRNLNLVELEIRRKVPSLREKDKIRLTLSIGKCHFPEKHTRIKTEVIELPTPVETDTDLLIKRLYLAGHWSDEDLKLSACYTLNNNS